MGILSLIYCPLISLLQGCLVISCVFLTIDHFLLIFYYFFSLIYKNHFYGTVLTLCHVLKLIVLTCHLSCDFVYVFVTEKHFCIIKYIHGN